MNVRLATFADIPAIGELFKESTEAIAAADYTPEQIALWISDFDKAETWTSRLTTQHFLLAHTAEHLLTGFASLDITSYLDMLYVHKDFQRHGIATQLVTQLEQQVCRWNLLAMQTEASITAKPFFEKMGYQVIHVQQKTYKAIALSNFHMQKPL